VKAANSQRRQVFSKLPIAKRAAGLYYPGKRTREWVKFKAVGEQEVVIVGYTEPRRSRKYFGSLVLAVRDKAKKCWVYGDNRTKR
jgi:bifunctional non-homologous end joining protein LigD